MIANISLTDCSTHLHHYVSMKNIDLLKESFALRFQQLMIDKGWDKITRAEAGKILGGVSAPAVTYWWKGDRLPTTDQAIIMAEKFGCSIEWLLTGNGEKYPYEFVDISSLSEDQRNVVIALLKTFGVSNGIRTSSLINSARKGVGRRLSDSKH